MLALPTGLHDPTGQALSQQPTTAAQRLTADAVIATVAPIPVPAALPLLASALALTAVWRRRRAA